MGLTVVRFDRHGMNVGFPMGGGVRRNFLKEPDQVWLWVLLVVGSKSLG